MLPSKQISHFDPNELTINFLSLVSMASVSMHNFDFRDLNMSDKQTMHCSEVQTMLINPCRHSILTKFKFGWSAPHPGRFTPGEDPVPNVQEAGWTPGPVWTCAKNLASTRIQTPDCPAHSQSLYQLSHPGFKRLI
jgi:hypothetical protein